MPLGRGAQLRREEGALRPSQPIAVQPARRAPTLRCDGSGNTVAIAKHRVDGPGRLPLSCGGGRQGDRVSHLRKRLTGLVGGRINALRGLSGTTFVGISIFAVAAISVVVLVLLGATSPNLTPSRNAVPISMTRLVTDAKVGQLSKAVIDEASLVVPHT